MITEERKNNSPAVQNELRESGVVIGSGHCRVIGIIGSRRRNTSADFRQCLSILRNLGFGPSDSIVSGGCPQGGDRFAEIIANRYGIPIVIHAANWQKHGRRAGLLRNTDIARDADILVAVVAADRKGGTEDTIRKFANMGKTDLILVPLPGGV